MIDREKAALQSALSYLCMQKAIFERQATPRQPMKGCRSALEIAINAVEKQIPQNVKNCRCPKCNRLVALKYCERCGQRLRWEGRHEKNI